MKIHKNKSMYEQINEKLGFDIREYNNAGMSGEAHEQDNVPNPFDKLTLDELLFLRENGYFLKA